HQRAAGGRLQTPRRREEQRGFVVIRSVFSKIKGGLERTRQGFVSQLRSLLRGKRLSAELIDELETRLIESDVGVHATRRLVEGIRADFKAGNMQKGEDALNYMKRE